MSEKVIHTLARWLQHADVVYARVIATRGATPRSQGSCMLISASECAFSVGGGLAEARVVAAARDLAGSGCAESTLLKVDLSGQLGSAGICGGSMEIKLRRLSAQDQPSIADLSARLAAGEWIEFDAERIAPDPRLLVIGAGHCGSALYDLAQHLDFDIVLYDERCELFDASRFPQASFSDDLGVALDTQRDVYAVLLNRDFAADIAALKVLARRPLRFVGMMGSRKRIQTVRLSLPADDPLALTLVSPVGLEINAETPHEIAVSILAQLIEVRRSRAGV